MDAAAAAAAASGALPPWVPLGVSVLALLFTVLAFWWNNWRRGEIMVGYPRTFAASTCVPDRTLLLLPLTLRNTGPTAIAVRALRLRISQADRSLTLAHLATRTAMRLEAAQFDFASNFVVEGRQTLLRLAQFEAERSFVFQLGSVTAALEILEEEAKSWRELRVFQIAIGAEAQLNIPTAYITYDNAASLPA